MANNPSKNITILLKDNLHGDEFALDKILQLVYDELIIISSKYLGD